MIEINDNHRLKATSLFINKVTDEVYEAGRNGEGFVFEETNRGELILMNAEDARAVRRERDTDAKQQDSSSSEKGGVPAAH